MFVIHQICDPEKEIDFIKNAIATNPKNKEPWLLLARKYAHKVYLDIDKPNLTFNRKELTSVSTLFILLIFILFNIYLIYIYLFKMKLIEKIFVVVGRKVL